jgi:hypothetical protein
MRYNLPYNRGPEAEKMRRAVLLLVQKGDRLGRITDFDGKTIEPVLAPFDGHVL